MAGDWMKIELELPDKPEVHAIAGTLNIDPDAVVGKLIRVWQWFDKHTTDGNAYGVTYSLADRISGVTGFGEAMSFVGWLEQQDKYLVMPKFDRHTSASAKTRAMTAKRVANHKTKTNGKGNAVTVSDSDTSALPREEKRRINNKTSEYSDEFQRFWDSYPQCKRKGGRPAAYKAWAKLGLDSKVDAILAHVAETVATRHPDYIAEPSSYLNKQGWDGWSPNAAHDDTFAGVL